MRVSKEKFLSIWENFNAFQSQCKNRKSVSQMSHTWHGQQRIGSRHKKYLLIEVKQKVTLIWINDNKGQDQNIQKIWGNCYSRQMNVFGWKRKSLSLFPVSFSTNVAEIRKYPEMPGDPWNLLRCLNSSWNIQQIYPWLCESGGKKQRVLNLWKFINFTLLNKPY